MLKRLPDISRLAERPNISPLAKARVAPEVSSFAVGDAVSGSLAPRLKSRPGTVAFVEIGADCEIAISWDGKFARASRASGPALEGMNVPCGSRARTGAADARATEDVLSFSFATIGGARPRVSAGTPLPTLSPTSPRTR